MIATPKKELQVARISGIYIFAAPLLALSLASVPSLAIDKMKPEDLVARHLESIGTASARTSIVTRIIAGTSQVIFRTPPPGQAVGRAVLASQGLKSSLA